MAKTNEDSEELAVYVLHTRKVASVCILHNNSVGNSHCVASDGWVVVNNELERLQNEAAVT
jgi:hypothetical protein